MKKDKVSAIRVNSEVLKQLAKDGKTPQQIIDEYIGKNYTIEETITVIKVK